MPDEEENAIKSAGSFLLLPLLPLLLHTDADDEADIRLSKVAKKLNFGALLLFTSPDCFFLLPLLLVPLLLL